MRRKDLELTDPEEIEAILRDADVVRLGLCRDGRPYVVPLAFGYEKGRLYFHSAPEGTKLEIIAANPRVCFEADVDRDLVTGEEACRWSFHYRSVVGFGTAAVVSDRAEKRRGLELLMAHYGGSPAGIPDEMVDSVEVVRVDVETLTGRAN